MGRLIYVMNVSLDGYVETPDHSLDWANVDDELHTWFNDRAREVQASLYGRRMYELMAAYWPTAESDPQATRPMREFARIWLETPKIVFSSTLSSVEWNSRLVRGDVTEELARLRQEFDADLEVSGPTLAAEFIRRGLVDVFGLVIHPVVLGAGTPFFPTLQNRIPLRLTETRRFESGVTLLAYEAARRESSAMAISSGS
ncbi:MAG: dihydrofolate reductase family protein [Chloroflexota bacterium]|nr:dihydrofolate reductase family protein [Chloroflexota bacterium]